MNSLLADTPAVQQVWPADQLPTSIAATRLSFTWFVLHKSLTAEQIAEAAKACDADGDVLSAGKRLINTKHLKYQAVTSICNRAVSLWKSITLPFPENRNLWDARCQKDCN